MSDELTDAEIAWEKSTRKFEEAQQENAGRHTPLLPEMAEALRAVVRSHCPNEAMFCGSCTPARAILKRYEEEK